MKVPLMIILAFLMLHMTEAKISQQHRRQISETLTGRCAILDRCCVGRDSSCAGISDDDIPYIRGMSQSCYCDESCLETGDCCPDYQEICNVQLRDCEVSEWGEWSACSTDCGEGVQTRDRLIAVHPSPGGEACPALNQNRVCTGSRCSHNYIKYKSPLRETAGLLPAKYYLSLHNDQPKYEVRENLFQRQKLISKVKDWQADYEEGYQADQPDANSVEDDDDDLNQQQDYCIVFELDKVSKACQKNRDFSQIEKGVRICALCPRDARRDSLGGRCKGHGVDSKLTRWRSTVHPSCHGKWKRVHEVKQCPCAHGPDFVFV